MARSIEAKSSSGPNSPCISVCSLDAGGYCSGCLRTRDEIASWMQLSSVEQWELLRTLDERRASRVPGADQS
jgi:predicted Fe-S protein YdhL (DUF1289 family)